MLFQLVITTVLQGIIIWLFLTAVCAVIGWLNETSKHICQHLKDDTEDTFDIGTIYCWTCLKLFFRVHGLKSSSVVGLLMACGSATCYITATIIAFQEDIVNPAYLCFGWILNVLSIAVTYGLDVLKSDPVPMVIVNIGSVCMVFAFAALFFELFPVVLVMGLNGAFTIIIGGFLNFMKSNVREHIN